MGISYRKFAGTALTLWALSLGCSTGRNTSPAPSADDPATNGKGQAAATASTPATTPAPATAPATAPAATGGAATYAATVSVYFKAKCLPCHNTGAQAPALDTYDAAKAGAAASASSMAAGSMPVGAKPPQADIDNINAWIKAGTPK